MTVALNVIIPTHGRPTLLARTIASLAACRLPEGYREAVIVENGSRAGAEAVVAKATKAYPHVRLRYMHVDRANKSHALNEALASVGGGLVFFSDDDVRFAPGLLEAYAEAAERVPTRAFFGGPMRTDYEVEPPDWLVPLLPLSAQGFNLVEERRRSCYLGCNWAAFAEDVGMLGGFDPAFGPGSPTGATGQETEMQQRMMAEGLRGVDVPAAVVWHYVPRERCSATWLGRREWRNGVSAGQRERVAGATPLHLVKKGLRGIGRGSLNLPRQVAKWNKVGWWRTVYSISYHSGLLCGAVGASGERGIDKSGGV